MLDWRKGRWIAEGCDGWPCAVRSRAALVVLSAATALLTASVGCNQNPYLAPQQPNGALPQQPYASQLTDAQQRMGQLDANNRDLHAQLAQSQQTAKMYQDQLELLRNQLRETASQLQQVQVAKEQAEQQVTSMLASTRQRGGATLTANNSLQRSLNPVNLPGLNVRTDGDLVRIELPSDQLFRTGTAQLQAAGTQMLDQVAQAIQTNYSRQRVAIEGHTDSAPSQDATAGVSNHLLTAQQAMAVFDQLTRRNRLPSGQLFVMGLGSNHPKASNATSSGRTANRRIEIVVYPEQY